MRVLVTGATGFIGSSLCPALAEAGHTVVALSRDADRARQRVPTLSAAFTWAPTEGPPPAAAFDAVDAVVNLAGEPIHGRWTPRRKLAIEHSRVLGTRHLVDAIEALGATRPGVLVSASAMGYYGDRGDAELTEADAPGSGFLADLSRAWEVEAVRAEGLGLRVVRVRNGNVVARGSYGLLASLLPLFKFGLGGPLGSGRQWWPWIHMADYTGLVRYVIEHDVAGPVNASAPQPARQREFARTLGRVLRRPALLPAPALALRLILGEFATEVLSSRRMLPAAALDAGFAFEHPELEGALRHALAA